MISDMTKVQPANSEIHFKAYNLFGEYRYTVPSDNDIKSLLFQFRFDNPNPFIAREQMVGELQKIRQEIKQDSTDPLFNYCSDGVHLHLEYEVSSFIDSDIDARQKKRYVILDGLPLSNNELFERLEGESNLLSLMGYKFNTCIFERDDGWQRLFLPLYWSIFNLIFQGSIPFSSPKINLFPWYPATVNT